MLWLISFVTDFFELLNFEIKALTNPDYLSSLSDYSYVSNNRVKLIIVLKGNLQLTSMSVIANNRVQ